MKKIIHKYGQWIGKSVSQLEWMIIFWIGMPLWIIAMGLVGLLILFDNSMIL